jgi:hypothetical protein
MKRIALGFTALALLGACGTTTGDRGLSGAAIGATVGAVGGGVGILGGAVVGGAVGVLTSPAQVNLGKPIWE